MPDVLCQQAAGDVKGVFYGEVIAACLIVAELYLKQVVTVGDSCGNGSFGILMDVLQLLLKEVERAEFFFQHDNLPEILLHCEAYFVFGLVELEAAGFHAYFCEFVGLHNLSSGKKGLDGSDAANDAVFQ